MMLSPDVILLIICWGLFAVIWGVGSVYNFFKGPKRQSGSSLDFYLSIIGGVVILLLYRFIRLLSPGYTLYMAPWLQILGGIFLVLSTGLTLWARFALGVMWSGKPETKVGHELRTKGPYRITRHPIYTGIFGMMLGSVLLSGVNILWLLVAIVTVPRLAFRIPVEEKMMAEMFGEQYRAYQKEVPSLIPGMQWLRFNKPTEKG